LGTNRTVFHCPAAHADAAWDTNVNKTLGGTAPDSTRDPWAITSKSRFSLGYNDWGLNLVNKPQLGLGGDIDGGLYQGPVKESMVVSPSQMIMLADSRAQETGFSWEANLDPTSPDQWPSNRHNRKTNLLFTDGHYESAPRGAVIDPTKDNLWRSRWNNDNQPHNEVSWSVNATQEAKLDE
jgi:prepilin-type processing-associated H-X9-DG protein